MDLPYQIAFKLKKGFPGGKKKFKNYYEMGPMKNEEKKQC